MREVIQGLIEAEGEARSIVQAAREEAERLVSDAEKRTQEWTTQTRRAARAAAAQSVEVAVEATEREKRKRLEKAQTEIQSQVHIDEAMRDRLVDAVVRCICGEL